ncbi:transcription termination factor MTERF5, chloroplastic-like [Solanum dulcamara]|uniref:transcription termination factor MTERF5, chloroplastic-like n=1 Tax=Solanum dulcamara TaxID=45834 RepID=UPI00248638AD|nr:transcription termination factor MTERF5, chloroplastic-like [Solanum dulcamara]XP_055836097.1 transcription termination factor MTERF5, chloroplastic-like [Solanum dulcamara]
MVSDLNIPTHQLPRPISWLNTLLILSDSQAASTSSKVTSLKSVKNPHLVINFLKQTGFDNTQMKKLVSRAPKLLIRDVSNTLKPKLRCLMDLGLSVSDLVNVIAKDPHIIGRGLATRLRPTIDFLMTTLVSDENVVKALKRFPWLLSFGALGIMETNLLLLRNYGVPDVRIKKLLLRNPTYFAQKPEWIKGLLHRVENDFQVPRDSPSFLYGFQALSWQKKSTLDRKFGIFKSFGWSDDDILHMFRKLPYCVGLSEVRIQEKLNFFMKELGFESAYLVSHPAILSYSLDKRGWYLGCKS